MTFKEHLLQYAERELELTGFMETEFGEPLSRCVCRELKLRNIIYKLSSREFA